jgi:hypothetical protein
MDRRGGFWSTVLLILLLFMAGMQPGYSQASQTSTNLETYATISPGEIWVKGSGSTPEKTKLTLTVKGVSKDLTTTEPVDAVLVIDRSESMAQSARLEAAKIAAKNFIALLNPETDRVGLVSFAATATVDQSLTFNQQDVTSKIDGLNAGGLTAIEDSIHLANAVLASQGRVRAAHLELILSDGLTNIGSSSSKEAEKAREAGIEIYTIGINAVDDTLLKNIATATGGRYYSAANLDNLKEIYNGLRRLAAEDIVVTVVLPEYVNHEGGYSEAPYSIIPNADGTTSLVWRVEALAAGAVWSVSFDISSKKSGSLPAIVYGNSKATYIDPAGASSSVIFPNVIMTAKPTQPPQSTSGEVEGADGGRPGASYLDFFGIKTSPFFFFIAHNLLALAAILLVLGFLHMFVGRMSEASKKDKQAKKLVLLKILVKVLYIALIISLIILFLQILLFTLSHIAQFYPIPEVQH